MSTPHYRQYTRTLSLHYLSLHALISDIPHYNTLKWYVDLAICSEVAREVNTKPWSIYTSRDAWAIYLYIHTTTVVLSYYTHVHSNILKLNPVLCQMIFNTNHSLHSQGTSWSSCLYCGGAPNWVCGPHSLRVEKVVIHACKRMRDEHVDDVSLHR